MSEFTIRPITVEDAAAFNAYRRRIADEPDNFIGHSVGEYTRSVEEERERILKALDDNEQQILLAEAQGEIIGQCTCRGASAVSAVRHVVGLGIDVDSRYRGKGVGSALMHEMIGWAKTNPIIRRVELDVFAHNRHAINLYLKCGFVIEGRKRAAYFKYGRFVDAYLMALMLDK